MEALLGYILLFAFIMWLVYLFIVYIVFPIVSALSGITITISIVYALYISLKSFISSLMEYRDPYRIYVDKHPDSTQGVNRNYFFGPGSHQLSCIVKGAFYNLKGHYVQLKVWKNSSLKKIWYVDMWIYLGYMFSIVCAQILGFLWTLFFSVLLAVVILVGMVVFFTFFSILWSIDRAVLVWKSIHNRCPSCKRKSVIPIFACPDCGLFHKKLVPGPYGVLKRKCTCSKKMATTFLAGRSQYEAYCPFCTNHLLSSVSKQYGIQLVGGVGMGKTTFLVAFWHEYKEWLSQRVHIRVEAKPEEDFRELEEWFASGEADATHNTNASMYSIIHSLEKRTPVQMTIYDIAGESFESSDFDQQQEQFKYCEGFLIAFDPTSSVEDLSKVFTKFVRVYDELSGLHVNKRSNIPVAVLITKADLYKTQIGLVRIKARYRQEGGDLQDEEAFASHRNAICRNFLLETGYANAVYLLEASFPNIRYFPISAMGHHQESGQYEPWGVLEPVFWLMNHDICPLKDMLQSGV